MSNFQRAGHLGTQFPITRQSVKGSGRQHIHEYPHTSGGQPEKLGRKLYEIKMRALFYDVFRTYGNLYPTALSSLVTSWENQISGPLVVPTIGTINAFCTDWPRDIDFSKVVSGEVVELTFLEDPPDALDAFTQTNLSQSASDSISTAILMAPTYPTVGINLLQSLQASINSILAIEQQAALYGTYLSNQVDGILAIFDQLDSSPALQNPANYPIQTVLADAAYQMIQYQQSLTLTQGTPMQYLVPYTMSVAQVSTAIFGDTSQAVTILQMNALDDALAIPAGTEITYLQAPAQAA